MNSDLIEPAAVAHWSGKCYKVISNIRGYLPTMKKNIDERKTFKTFISFPGGGISSSSFKSDCTALKVQKSREYDISDTLSLI